VRAAQARNAARSQLDSDLRQRLGAPIALGLSFAEFQRTSSVQQRWQDSLGAPRDVRLSHDMGFHQFRARIYEPKISSIVATNISNLFQPAETYADGGVHARIGREAMERLLVPPMALAISLLGALYHTFKSLRYLHWSLGPTRGRWWREWIIGFLVLFCVALPFWAPNHISQSRAFSHLEAQLISEHGYPIGKMTRWIIQAQPYFYPLNEAVRRNVLLGLDFGYRGGVDQGPVFPTQPPRDINTPAGAGSC
jgi:hypothetical protein